MIRGRGRCVDQLVLHGFKNLLNHNRFGNVSWRWLARFAGLDEGAHFVF